MTDEKKNVEIEEADVITLEFDDGAEVECEIMGVFDYNGKEKSDLRTLVYGWMLADADQTLDDDPLMAYVPTGQYDASGEMRDVRMVRGSTWSCIYASTA